MSDETSKSAWVADDPEAHERYAVRHPTVIDTQLLSTPNRYPSSTP